MLSGDIFSSEVAISFIPEKPEIDVSTPSKVTVHDIEDSLESPSQGHEATIDPKKQSKLIDTARNILLFSESPLPNMYLWVVTN